MAEWERWNTHFSTTVEQEVLGFNFRLCQDPNSENLGTTVWDASIILAKYLEKNASRGEFSRKKARGSRVLELGAGMGLGGMAFALLGCKEVILTDMEEVLPLLQKNADANVSRSALMGTEFEDKVGKVSVCELNWKCEEQCAAVDPPFDFVLAADCVYHENHLEDLRDTILRVTNNKSTVLIVNELRCESVNKSFLGTFGDYFSMRKVPHSQMHNLYQHPAVQIYVLKRRRTAIPNHSNSKSGKELEPQNSTNDDQDGELDGSSDPSTTTNETSSECSDEKKKWQTRRLGVEAAQMLKDLRVPSPEQSHP